MKNICCKPTLAFWFAIIVAILTALSSQSQTTFKSEIKGKGTPMILIPGLTCSGQVWDETVAHYQGNFECHVITLAGFGSQPPVSREHFLAAVKDELITYIQNKKLNDVVIIGHSLGGFLALWVASDYPGKLSKVISVDGYPFLTAVMMPGATAESAKAMAGSMTQGMATQTREEMAVRTRMSLSNMISDPSKIDFVMETARLSDPKTQAQAMTELLTIDNRSEVAKIKCPVMVMGSWIAYKDYGQTHDLALLTMKNQTSAIKDLILEVSDTAKHFIFLDDPKWFFTKTDAFLR